MSYISDFKSSSFGLFGVKGGMTSNDLSLANEVGQRFNSGDYREFVLVQNAGTALVSGVLVQSPITIGANHTGLAVVANAAIGATEIKVTAGGTLVTKNQYAGGFAVISAGTGLGQTLRIDGNSAATSAGTCTITLRDPLSVAITSASSKVSLTLNPYGAPNGTDVRTSGVVVSPAAGSTGTTIGVTVYPIPASTATVPSYGFIQTRGFVSCLNDSNTAIGLDVMPSSSVDGAVVTYLVGTRNRVGTSTVAGVDTKSLGINIQL